MNKYGQIAIKAVEEFKASPKESWDIAAKYYFPCSKTSRDKSCPKRAFLDLYESNLIIGIENKSKGIRNRDGKFKYAIKAIDILIRNKHIKYSPIKLWKELHTKPKTHNNQMDVVIALWDKKLIKR